MLLQFNNARLRDVTTNLFPFSRNLFYSYKDKKSIYKNEKNELINSSNFKKIFFYWNYLCGVFGLFILEFIYPTIS